MKTQFSPEFAARQTPCYFSHEGVVRVTSNRGVFMVTVVFESLESRRLMSQTLGQLLTSIQGNVASTKTTAAASVKISTTDQHALAVDLRPVSNANAVLLKKLEKDFNAALANVRANLKLAAEIGVADMNKANAAVATTTKHSLSKPTLALANKALAKLSKDDNAFVSTASVNAFYTLTAVPATDEASIGTSNTQNAKLSAALSALEARANFSTTLFPEFNALVQNIATFATFVTSHVAGTVF
jgi:hypothetical protein